jgi:hypothetical protein
MINSFFFNHSVTQSKLREHYASKRWWRRPPMRVPVAGHEKLSKMAMQNHDNQRVGQQPNWLCHNINKNVIDIVLPAGYF